jgi:hypothetical protein
MRLQRKKKPLLRSKKRLGSLRKTVRRDTPPPRHAAELSSIPSEGFSSLVPQEDEDEHDDDVDDGDDLPSLHGGEDEDDDLLFRCHLLSFNTLMADIGMFGYFTSTAGGSLSLKTVKLYISRFQHFMLFCRSRYFADAGHHSVVDRSTFLAFYEIILANLSDWLPPYIEDLTEREDLAPDTVRNVVNHTLAIVKWYLLFAPRLLAETGMDTANSNLLLSQATSLCQHLSRQLGKEIRKQRTGCGRDLIEFKVSLSFHKCGSSDHVIYVSAMLLDLEQAIASRWASGAAASRAYRGKVLRQET